MKAWLNMEDPSVESILLFGPEQCLCVSFPSVLLLIAVEEKSGHWHWGTQEADLLSFSL